MLDLALYDVINLSQLATAGSIIIANILKVINVILQISNVDI